MRFGGLSYQVLHAAFAAALASALAGRDLSLDDGFGPDTEHALIDLAFARADAGPDLTAEVRSAFVTESGVPPAPVPSYDDAVRVVLPRMALCSLLKRQAAHGDPPDNEAVRRHRDERRTWLARLATLDSGQLQGNHIESIIGAAQSPTTGPIPELRPPDVLEKDSLAEIFDQEIRPETCPATEPRAEPSALLLCRSSAHSLSALRIAFERDCAAVDPDLLTAYHPRAAISMDAGVLRDTLLWTVMAIRYAVERRLDIVVQTAADEPQRTADVAALFADAGYRVEVYNIDDTTIVAPVASGGDR